MQGLDLFRGPGLGQGLGTQEAHILAYGPAKFSALSLTAISFLCFSKSWDNMNVRARNSVLTNEQELGAQAAGSLWALWASPHQRSLGTLPQGPKELIFQEGMAGVGGTDLGIHSGRRDPGCQSHGLWTFDLTCPVPMPWSGY